MKKLLFLLLVTGLVFGGNLVARSGKSMLGQPLPTLNLDYVSAAPEYTGKPMILEFWATWCPPCRKSIPHLNEIYAKYKEEGLIVIGVTEEDNTTIKAFTKKTPIDYSAATDRGGRLKKSFEINGIPHAVLVNKEGNIVWEGHPMSLTDAEIQKILK